MDDLTALVRDLAATQRGCFSYRQARAAGLTDANVRTALRTGALVTRGRGVLALPDPHDVHRADEHLTNEHLAEVQARLLQLAPGWVVARRSAALALGLPLLGHPPPRPQLIRAKQRLSDRGRNRFERRATLVAEQIVLTAGLQVTSAARTVVDLAREEGFRVGLVAADGALRDGLHPDALMAQARACATWPGGLTGLRVAREANGLAESALESISRPRMAVVAPPELQVNIYVGSEFVARVDFLWRAQHLVGEADGRGKYGGDADTVHAQHQRQAAREARLRDLGFEVLRWTWEEASRAGSGLEDRLVRAMARGSRTLLDPRVRFGPAGQVSLRRTP